MGLRPLQAHGGHNVAIGGANNKELGLSEEVVCFDTGGGGGDLSEIGLSKPEASGN